MNILETKCSSHRNMRVVEIIFMTLRLIVNILDSEHLMWLLLLNPRCWAATDPTCDAATFSQRILRDEAEWASVKLTILHPSFIFTHLPRSQADFWVLILRPVEEKNLEIPPRVNGCSQTQLVDENVGCVFPFLTLPVSSRCRQRAANAFHLRSVASLPPCSFTYLLCTRCCSSSLPGRSPQCLRSPAPAPWHRTRTPAARPPPGNTDKQI